MQKNSVAILIPVYNNPLTIQKVITDALLLNIRVIVVDDGSEIEVSSIVEVNNHLLTIVRHKENSGKGEALLTGIKEAKEQGFKFVIAIDGDGQHYPKEALLLMELIEDEAIIIGNRKFKKDVPISSKFGRTFSNFWIFMESGRWLNDTQSGFRLYPISILELNLKQSHYDFEIEVLVQHLWKKRVVKEVDIEVYYPPKGTRVSHFNKVTDNIRLSKLHSLLVFKNLLRLGTFGYYKG